jgi:2-polyprenyl-3-methyl-5-hydroxy-6-metoxy-1,4-benzoquinol methylase
MKLDSHYVDTRLVELYDRDNPRGVDTDFYLALATDINAHRIIDFGCGTGLLTCELAVEGRKIIGIDPSLAMLAVAQRKPSAERIQWIEGDSSALGEQEADLAIMTGNVAQVFLDDSEWKATLHALHATLRPGGYLAFESRNPLVREWERWIREDTFEQINTPFGLMECWLELVNVENGKVRFVAHNVFKSTGENVVTSSELRFRHKAELDASLIDAGFTIKQVYGNWHREPFTEASRLMVFIAQRN